MRTRRLEEILAMRMLILEEEKMERLSEMTRKKEDWIKKWRIQNMEKTVTKMLKLDLADHDMEWGEVEDAKDLMELDDDVCENVTEMEGDKLEENTIEINMEAET